MRQVDSKALVVLVPGGGSSVHGYFPELDARLGAQVRLIEVDPEGLDVTRGRRWLRLRDHARVLADTIDAVEPAPVLVVGHSLGGLVALRLAIDHREKVDGLLLLDPSPLMPAMLLPRPVLDVLGVVRRLSRKVLGVLPSRNAQPGQARPRILSLYRRLLWYLVLDGVALAADVRALDGLPTVVVSAGEHTASSAIRRTHERLAKWLPNATLEVWPNTTHGVPTERPAEVAETIAGLLARLAADVQGSR